jgi:hypothetical protein
VASKGSKDFFFVNKKEAKKTLFTAGVGMAVPEPARAKVFCFFFSKKKRFFSYLAWPARRGCRLSPA